MNNIGKSMATLWPSIRISLVLVLITVSLILSADFLGVTPNKTQYELDNRKQLSESLAIMFSAMVSDNDLNKVRTVLSTIVLRNDDLLSAGFRLKSNKLLFEIGPHVSQWADYKGTISTSSHVLVPIYRGRKHLGTIELRFKNLSGSEGLEIFNNPTYRLVLFVFVLGFFSFLFFMLRTLRQINPSAVVPGRVNAAFDTLSEGLVILDNDEQIVLANSAFCEMVERNTTELLGFKLSDMKWNDPVEDAGDFLCPWLIAMSTGESSIGEMLLLDINPKDRRMLTINSAPIHDSEKNLQGILLTFDDVTEIEVQKQQLQQTVSDLESSKQEIQRQNKELHFLATRDPLTGCLNRRSFNDLFAESFNHARSHHLELTCIMVDIDHFKRVNDNYGHGIGDDVIKLLADVLNSCTRDEDIVSRYGGEEFCIVLPGINISEALSVAERIRLKVKKETIDTFEAGPHITASFGVSSILDHAKDPAKLNDQADQALYIAKESGRNRVINWSADPNTQPLAIPVLKEPYSENKNTQNRIPITDHVKQLQEINQLQAQIKQLENTASLVSDQLQREQNYDKQTGLPKQSLFHDRIKQALEKATRENRLTALLILEFDLISQANNSYGMEIAEKMFASLTERIVSVFRLTDSITLFNYDTNDLMISRFEADEFGVLLNDLKDRQVVTWAVKRIFEAMSLPISFEDKHINVTCKIGISIFPEDARSAEELFSHANTAKTFAQKDNEVNNFQFYDPEMQRISLKHLGLEAEIIRAIKNEEWVLHYQPKINTLTKKIMGVEALVRWNHPERGLLSPYEFIAFSEQRGLIIEISDWIMRTACKQAKIWSDQGFDLKVAVNISAVQLRQEKLSGQILDIIKETQIHPRQLELEVTETMLMNNVDMAINTLNRLHCRGLSISIDDFGTGYSSLGYLKHLPIDILKIDRVFITDIMTDEYDKNIVESIISLAHGLNLKVIAEGVETQEQYEALRELSCDEIQGYLFSKPVDAETATKLLEQNEALL